MPNMRVAASVSSRGGSDVPRWIGGNDSYTQLLLHCNGVGTSFVDNSANGHTVLPTAGMQQVRANKKFGYKSAYFDGDGDYLEISGDLSGFSFLATDPFCIDFWASFDQDSTSRDQYILSKGDFETSGYAVYYTTADGKLHLKVNGTSVLSFTWAFNANQWYHIALVGDGANLKFYVDGQEMATVAQIALP